jgi:hypothetical protein
MQPAYITTTGPAGRIQGTTCVPSANVRAVNSKRWRESCRAVQGDDDVGRFIGSSTFLSVGSRWLSLLFLLYRHTHTHTSRN